MAVTRRWCCATRAAWTDLRPLLNTHSGALAQRTAAVCSTEPIECTVTAEVGRNEEKRLRVLKMTAVLKLGVSAASLQHLDRVLDQFEAFCTVTQSVGQGIAIELQVVDAAGVRLK